MGAIRQVGCVTSWRRWAHQATPTHCPCTWQASPLNPGLGHRLMRVSSDDLLPSPLSSSQLLVLGCCLPRGTPLGLGPALSVSADWSGGAMIMTQPGDCSHLGFSSTTVSPQRQYLTREIKELRNQRWTEEKHNS